MALLIYWMVLFLNPDQLIDVNIVKIFMSRNPVPTLLGDILHSFHSRTMRKRGILMIIYPPNSRKHLKGLSCAFSPFLLDKRIVGGESC